MILGDREANFRKMVFEPMKKRGYKRYDLSIFQWYKYPEGSH
jgi:hypothetical protein